MKENSHLCNFYVIITHTKKIPQQNVEFLYYECKIKYSIKFKRILARSGTTRNINYFQSLTKMRSFRSKNTESVQTNCRYRLIVGNTIMLLESNNRILHWEVMEPSVRQSW